MRPVHSFTFCAIRLLLVFGVCVRPELSTPATSTVSPCYGLAKATQRDVETVERSSTEKSIAKYNFRFIYIRSFYRVEVSPYILQMDMLGGRSSISMKPRWGWRMFHYTRRISLKTAADFITKCSLRVQSWGSLERDGFLLGWIVEINGRDAETELKAYL